MTAQQPQPQRTILTDDGELHDVHSLPETHEATIYCNNCGAANRMSARFCRSCGESLDEQIPVPDDTHTFGAPGQKTKRTFQPASAPSPAPNRINIWSVVLEFITLMAVAGMVTTTARSGGVLPIAILIAWIIVEGVRYTGRRS
jgi:hypothetical protein